jgi:hypothetical protein
MFLDVDEHMLIMDDIDSKMRLSDFQKLESCGVKTVYLHEAIHLHRIFSNSDCLIPNWEYVDERINPILENTNLKMVVPYFSTPPRALQHFWYANNIINYGNPDVGKSIDDYFRIVRNHLPLNRVQLVYAFDSDGEFIWRTKDRSFPFTEEIVINFMVERQKLFSLQHNEIWNPIHNTLGWIWDVIDNINSRLCLEFPHCNQYRIQFSHFPMTWPSFGQDIIKKNYDLYGIKYFVGSEFIEGININMPKALEQYVWGYLTSPIHHFTKRKQIDTWMLEIIRNANNTFSEVWRER